MMKNAGILRQEFLKFFKGRGHKIVPSSSLLPNDPSVLFTTAGMQQFKAYFLGNNSPYGPKVATCQKCVRTSDIESVGDQTHLTFFEMLGNFSFGDYFKKETIEMALDFLTKRCSLNIENLWVTVFNGEKLLIPDKESKKIWENLGIPKSRICGFGKDYNFWGPTGNSGPCGPTTEIYFDLTGKPCKKGERCAPNCDCGRFLEIWNLVFNEYYQDENKTLTLLKTKGVDTGMGLERIVMVIQKKNSIFETDLFSAIIESIKKNSLISKNNFGHHLQATRIIADHLKASSFLIAEGILPSKSDKGYILRRLLRRSVRYAKIIGLNEKGWHDVIQNIIEIYKKNYPELEENSKKIFETIFEEREKFEKTIQKGLKEFEKINCGKAISGEKAFFLYETHGFPLELILELAKEKGLSVDINDFYKAQLEHQKISRIGAEKKFSGLGLEKVTNKEDKGKIIRLHTATHLLQAALRQVLGSEIKQMGSDINSERLRFDFSFTRKIGKDEIREIEEIVNQKIRDDLFVNKTEMPLKQAQEMGALAFFKEKYPENVSVYSIRDNKSKDTFSTEVCFGPHVERTSLLGIFKIIKEEAVGSGIRRIKATLK